MKEAFERAKKPLKQQRGKNIKEFRADIRKAKEIEALHGMKKKDEFEEEMEDGIEQKPLHIRQQEKVQDHLLREKDILQQEIKQSLMQLKKIDSKEINAKKNLEELRIKQNSNLGLVLAKIAENKTKADAAYEIHLDETATNFIRKQLKIQQYREKRDKDIEKTAKKNDQDLKKKFEAAKDVRKQNLKERRYIYPIS